MLEGLIELILDLLGVKIINTATDMTKHKGLRTFAFVLLSIVYVLSILILGGYAVFNKDVPMSYRLISGVLSLWLITYYIKIIKRFRGRG